MHATNRHLVFVNGDDERHDLQVTVTAAGDAAVLDHTADLSADERRRFDLEIEEPGTYTVSATVDGNVTESWSINFDEYDLEAGTDVFVEVDDGRPTVYWQE